MPRTVRWVAAGVVGALLAGLLGAAVTLALMTTRSDTTEGIDEQPVTAAVTQQQIRQLVAVDVTEDQSNSLDIHRTGIHTAGGAAPTTELREGDVVTVVDEQATVIIQGSFPLYRELRPGSSGADVAQVRTALNRMGLLDAEGDVVDEQTAQAMLQLFSRAGYPLRDPEGATATAQTLAVAPELIAVVPSLPATPNSQCGRLGATSADVVCTLIPASGSLIVAAPAGSEAAPGQIVEFSLNDGTTVRGTLVEALPVGEDQARQRFAVTFEEPAPADDTIARATIIAKESTADALTVPAAALQEVTGNQASLRGVDEQSIAVTIGMCAEGRCVVTGEGLSDGMAVVVP